jgi:L-asparaginase II
MAEIGRFEARSPDSSWPASLRRADTPSIVDFGSSPGAALCSIEDGGVALQQAMESTLQAGQTLTVPVVAGTANSGGSQDIAVYCSSSSGSGQLTVVAANLIVQADG